MTQVRSVAFVTFGGHGPWLRVYQLLLFLLPGLKIDKAGARFKSYITNNQENDPAPDFPVLTFKNEFNKPCNTPAITNRAALEWVLKRIESKGM